MKFKPQNIRKLFKICLEARKFKFFSPFFAENPKIWAENFLGKSASLIAFYDNSIEQIGEIKN